MRIDKIKIFMHPYSSTQKFCGTSVSVLNISNKQIAVIKKPLISLFNSRLWKCIFTKWKNYFLIIFF